MFKLHFFYIMLVKIYCHTERTDSCPPLERIVKVCKGRNDGEERENGLLKIHRQFIDKTS